MQGLQDLLSKKLLAGDALARHYNRIKRAGIGQHDALPAGDHKEMGRPVKERIVMVRQRGRRHDLDLLCQFLCYPEYQAFTSSF